MFNKMINDEQKYLSLQMSRITKEVEKQYPNLNFYIVMEDPRYPQIIFNDNPNNPEWDNCKGFWWDLKNNKLGSNFCTCGAYEPDECSCGAWDDVDRDWWYDE